MFWQRHWIMVWIAVAYITCGCGKDAGVQLAPVTGVVTLNGEPLPNAIVEFNPKEQPVLEGKGKPVGGGSVAVTDDEGRYVLRFGQQFEGAVVGEHQVRVRPLPVESEEEIDRKKAKAARAEAKKIMATQLVFDVQPGENEFDIDLKTR